MSLLLSPYEHTYIHLKNKVVMPPMCMYKADTNGNMTDFHLTHYTARALGGVGLIIVEATAVEPRGRISDNDLGLWDDTHIEAHKKLVASCHAYGAKMAVQLAHAGRKSICKETTPVAPSAMAYSQTNGFKLPHALSLDEITQIKTQFVQAGLRAARAGYDILELHAAHGYLLCEFLSPLTNTRDDAYGGSLENRCALTLEIAHLLIQTTGLPLCVRISADEWVEGGWDIAQSIYLASKLKELGVTFIHVSAGGNQEKQIMPPLTPLYQAGYAKTIRKEVDVATIAVGLITTAHEGEALLRDGGCDLVAYGRELLRNPNFVFFAAKEHGLRDLIEVSYLRAF